MSGESVDQLREQLRERGYLTHGIERWFALDPWRSGTFWVELAIVAAKGGLILALFGALPEVAVMLARNYPLGPAETLSMLLLYGVTWFVASSLLMAAIGLLLKIRPEVAIDTPRALLAISLAAAALLVSPIAVWWYRFDTPPGALELAAGLLLVLAFFLVSTVVVSAALLAFSVHELRRIPAIHRKSRTLPMTISAAILMAALFAAAHAVQEKSAPQLPLQVVTAPTQRRLALVAVDGLTFEIFRTRPELERIMASANAAPAVPGESTTERWASVGTGVPTAAHGVRAIEGVRLAGGSHVLQSVSRADVVLRNLGGTFGIARRQPLPPTVRKRDYVWEIVAARGIPSVAVNWWTSPTGRFGALDSIGQESLFAAARGDALNVDREAAARLETAVAHDRPQLATLYLPALDVVLNRLPLDVSSRLSASIRALDGIEAVTQAIRARGYDVILIGLPGDGQQGRAVIGATFSLPSRPSPSDVAPTILSLLGFPASVEMPGKTLVGEGSRIPSYGVRNAGTSSLKVDEEYFENLKSLGYIK